MKIGVSKYYRNPKIDQIRDRLVSVPVSAEAYDTTGLANDTLNLLDTLEVRSWAKHGHTKVNNETLSKHLGLSPRTIQRHLNILEKRGFIVRVVTRKRAYDEKNGKVKFYCDRYFQCNRVMIAFRFRVLDTKTIGWKTDYRPKLTLGDFKVPISFIDEIEYVESDSNYNRIHHKPFFTSYFDLMVKGYMGGTMWDMLRNYEDRAEQGDPAALEILGLPRRKDNVSSQQA